MTDSVNTTTLTGKLQAAVESTVFQRAITTLIVINAITLGLETSPTVMDAVGGLLTTLDRVVLAVFVLELAIKIAVYRTRFPRDPWNIFDFIIVAIALVPATGSLSVLRALRVLRVLRLVSTVPSMRRVIGALLHATPGMGSIIALLALVFYVFSVMATNLFGGAFPEWFGSVGASAFTLFQIMTLESWSMGVVRPLMEVFPFAWLFFVPFILLTTFTVLNLFIGIVVDAMQSQHAEENEAERAAEQAQIAQGFSDRAEILAEIRALREEVAALRPR
ncbi:MAG: ion transporter [Proteobacteria bacterium]|nr:ion transporter [Pseudomonadota bacterium]